MVMEGAVVVEGCSGDGGVSGGGTGGVGGVFTPQLYLEHDFF